MPLTGEQENNIGCLPSTLASEVMACIRGFEHLPHDALREIIIRVAGQPKGAADIARVITVSKSLRDFMKDEDVLRAVSFEDLFPRIAGQHELLLEVGGLLVSCSRAGNSDAQFILSKVVLLSASVLCNVKTEAAQYDGSWDQFYSETYIKSSYLLDHLSAQNTNPAELFNLVRGFLSRAKFRDFVEMQRHLKSFVSVYAVPGTTLQQREFFTPLNTLCAKRSFPLAFNSDPIAYLNRHLNTLCESGHGWMKEMGIDEEVISPLLQCTVERDDDVGYETLVERLDIVMLILKHGSDIARTSSDRTVLLTERGISCLAAMVTKQLAQLMEFDVFFHSSRGLLLARFDALFDIQQG